MTSPVPATTYSADEAAVRLDALKAAFEITGDYGDKLTFEIAEDIAAFILDGTIPDLPSTASADQPAAPADPAPAAPAPVAPVLTPPTA